MAEWIYRSPLVDAVDQRDCNKLRAAIAGMSADKFRKHAYSGLIRACSAGLAGLVRILLEAGADPNDHQLAWCCRYSLVRYGSEEFAKESRSPEMLKVCPADFPLETAAWTTPELVTLLLEHGANPNSVEPFGDTPLMKAARATRSRMTELLIKAGADVNAVDIRRISVLQEAAAWGKCKTLELLLSHGASVNHQDDFGDTALTDAARRGNAAQLHTLMGTSKKSAASAYRNFQSDAHVVECARNATSHVRALQTSHPPASTEFLPGLHIVSEEKI